MYDTGHFTGHFEAECEILPTNLLITLKAHESTGKDHRTSL